jgi:transposase
VLAHFILIIARHSLDLNPIKQMFAKLKALLRKIAARSVEALWTASSQLVSTFEPDECRNYLRYSGYVRST